MALITCPECEKEISDKVTACPHCGYPFSEDMREQTNPKQVEISPVELSTVELKVETPKSKKKLLLFIIAVVVIIISAFAVNQYHAKKVKAEYIEKLQLAQADMLSGGIVAERVCNLTRKVWYNTIFEKNDKETDAYTINNKKSNKVLTNSRSAFSNKSNFNEDFNDSLSALYSDSNIMASVNELKEHQEKIAALMAELQKPPKGLEACYDTVESMHDSYFGLVNLAISPKGTLETYSNDLSTYDNDFMKYYHKLDTQIPKE